VKKYFGYASKTQILQLFNKFYPKNEDLGKKLLDHIPSNSFTMATLQKHFVEHKGEPEKAIANSHLLMDEHINNDEENIPISNWLKRLGLAFHIDSFHKEKVYHLEDIQDISENTLKNTFKVSLLGEANLILGMLAGKKDILSGFEFCPKETVRKLALKYCGKFKKIDQFVEQFADKVSSYELIQFFESYPSSDPMKNVEFLINPPTKPTQKSESLKDWIDRTKLNEIFKQKFVEEDKSDEDEEKETKESEDKNDEKKSEVKKSEKKEKKSEKKSEKKEKKKEIEPKKEMTIYEKLISEDIVDTLDLAELSESDFESFGIKLKGSLIKIMKEINKLKNEE
jgi:hypothetical protein